MEKTTVYLPVDLKAAISAAAVETGRSEAEVIRDAIRAAMSARVAPKPTFPIYISDDPHFAEHVDEYLRGYGER